MLERYELLYEAGLVRGAPATAARPSAPARRAAMALDHRRIAGQALGRLRGKLRYRPVVFELLPATFTLVRLQRVVEALSGVAPAQAELPPAGGEAGGLVEPHRGGGRATAGRPAAVFRFRREVLRERPAPGVGLPGLRRG